MNEIPWQGHTTESSKQTVKHSPAVAFTAATRELDLVRQTLCGWKNTAEASTLLGSGTKPMTPERMDLSRLRAESAWLKMHVHVQE